MNATTFTRIPLPSITRDTFSAFNAGTNIYTIPATADYLLSTVIRLQDNTPSTCVGHGLTTAETPEAASDFYWRNIYNDLAINRTTLSNCLVRSLTVGTLLRLVVYSDGALADAYCSVTIAKLT